MKKTLFQVLGLWVFQSCRYLSNNLCNFIGPSMDAFCWCSQFLFFLVYLRGTPIWPEDTETYFGHLDEWSSELNQQTFTLELSLKLWLPKKGYKSLDKCLFFDMRDGCFLSPSAITLKFKMCWLPNQARYWAELG